MADGIYDSRITATDLGEHGVQYDVEPLDPNSERVTILVSPEGAIRFIDEDGVYEDLPGQPLLYPDIDLYSVPPLPFQESACFKPVAAADVQVYLDLENSVRIEIGFDEGTRYVGVDTCFSQRGEDINISGEQSLTAIPADDIAINTFVTSVHTSNGVVSREITQSGEALMAPGGELPPAGMDL